MTPETLDAPTAIQQLKPVTAYFVPLELIRPSPYNPRKRFAEAGLEELADSIAAHGVQQAIVLRKVEAVKPGGAEYEIVAGERRWRASKVLAARGGHQAPHTIPGFIRELDDFQACEIALTENSHRNDLHPLEEAQAYENLLLKPVGGGEFKPPRVKGYTVDELAEKIGHKPNFVFGRLKLLELVPAAKEAFLEDKLQLKSAERLARISPAKEQERALAGILSGWGGEPYTHRQALKYLHDNFMLKLGKAIFPIEDATLVPKAGACTDCQKRSGANPDLFDGIGSDDMCLDSVCHGAKVKALGDRQIAKARDAGQAVLIGAAAKKVLGSHSSTSDYALRNTGHVDLDKPLEELTGNRKSLRTLLGDDFDKVIVVKGEHDDQPSTVALQADVKAALKAKGLLKPSTKSKPGSPGKNITPDDIKAKRAERIDAMLGERVHAALAKHLESDGAEGFPAESGAWIAWMAEYVFDATDANLDAIEAALTGGKITGRLVDAVKGEKLVRALIMMVIGTAIADEFGYRSNGDPKKANQLAKDVGFDLAAFRKDVAEEVDGAIHDEIQALADVVAPAAKKTAAPKKVAAKKKAALTPVKALAAAVAKDKSAKSTQDKKPPSPQISAAAAWPFPTGRVA